MGLVHAGAARTKHFFAIDLIRGVTHEIVCVCLSKAVRFDKGQAALGERGGGALFSDFFSDATACVTRLTPRSLGREGKERRVGGGAPQGWRV